jgi:hypothetical protein
VGVLSGRPVLGLGPGDLVGFRALQIMQIPILIGVPGLRQGYFAFSCESGESG